MGLKGAASSLMQAYKCWSLWFLLPAACWSGLEEQLLQRPEGEALGATGKILQEKTRDTARDLIVGAGLWGHDRDEYFSKEVGVKCFRGNFRETLHIWHLQIATVGGVLSPRKKIWSWDMTAAKFYHRPSHLYVGQTVHHVGDWSVLQLQESRSLMS